LIVKPQQLIGELMQVRENSVVSIHYKLTDDAGSVLDSSEGRDPLSYLHGRGNLIPGLEKALEGKAAGEKINVTVVPEEAYGIRDEKLVREIPRDAFKEEPDLKPGMRFQSKTDGGTEVFTVSTVTDDVVTVDGNHPLAGEALTFDVEVTEIREATEEELSHGHVHGPGGHDH
jgi:FKBP-type peptidyl-prolyl cis-trans isomerase SlyD